jgi:hypothetical protein
MGLAGVVPQLNHLKSIEIGGEDYEVFCAEATLKLGPESSSFGLL